MTLRGQSAPPREQPIPTVASPRVHRVTPSTMPLTPSHRLPVQVTQHVSKNLPLLSTYHPSMKVFTRLKKRNRPQRHNKKAVFHLPCNSLSHNIPTLKMSSSLPIKTSLLQKQANATFLYPAINHIYRKDGRKETIAFLLQGPDSPRWSKALSNEIDRLAQGNK